MAEREAEMGERAVTVVAGVRGDMVAVMVVEVMAAATVVALVDTVEVG